MPDRFTESLIGLVFASLDEDNTLLVDGFPRMYSQKKCLMMLCKITQRFRSI